MFNICMSCVFFNLINSHKNSIRKKHHCADWKRVQQQQQKKMWIALFFRTVDKLSKICWNTMSSNGKNKQHDRSLQYTTKRKMINILDGRAWSLSSLSLTKCGLIIVKWYHINYGAFFSPPVSCNFFSFSNLAYSFYFILIFLLKW